MTTTITLAAPMAANSNCCVFQKGDVDPVCVEPTEDSCERLEGVEELELVELMGEGPEEVEVVEAGKEDVELVEVETTAENSANWLMFEPLTTMIPAERANPSEAAS